MTDDIRATARTFYAQNASQHLSRDTDLMVDRCAHQLEQTHAIGWDAAYAIASTEQVSDVACDIELRD